MTLQLLYDGKQNGKAKKQTIEETRGNPPYSMPVITLPPIKSVTLKTPGPGEVNSKVTRDASPPSMDTKDQEDARRDAAVGVGPWGGGG